MLLRDCLEQYSTMSLSPMVNCADLGTWETSPTTQYIGGARLAEKKSGNFTPRIQCSNMQESWITIRPMLRVETSSSNKDSM